ncbi:MAG: glycosyltransferase [Sandaracinaceae bacterium]|nr:glycosyltransferase [Sandaracinaceae bacterium]
MIVALTIFEAARLLLRTMLLVLSFHFLRAAWTGLREADPERPPDPERWPRVLVQLPLKNEFYVAERVIRCAAALDYPADRLAIQVLDDSDDETTERVRAVVDELAAGGAAIELLHRDVPKGYKAGALNAGLARTDADLVAIFDADCVPPRDFLRRTVPFFADASVACVQVRWSFLNRGRSLLTRVQAMVLDGLFAIDQFARAASRLPMQFNGTNGLWRASVVREVGGFRGDILAEDADLSFRAHLAGHRLVHLREYAVPTELPEDMAAFRTQQHRWSVGSAQLLRSLAWPIARSRLPVRSKLMMFLHMGRHAIDPLVVMASITSPFTTLYGLPFLVDYTVPVNGALLGLVGLGCVVFYGAALRYVGAPSWHVLLIPLVIPLAIGLSARLLARLRGGPRAARRHLRPHAQGGRLARRHGPPLRVQEAARRPPGGGDRGRAHLLRVRGVPARSALRGRLLRHARRELRLGGARYAAEPGRRRGRPPRLTARRRAGEKGDRARAPLARRPAHSAALARPRAVRAGAGRLGPGASRGSPALQRRHRGLHRAALGRGARGLRPRLRARAAHAGRLQPRDRAGADRPAGRGGGGLSALPAALPEPGHPELRADAQQLLAALSPRIARLTLRITNLSAGDRIELDGVELPAAVVGSPVPINPGGHELTVLRRGSAIETREIEVREGGTATVELTLPVPTGPSPEEPAVPPAGGGFDVGLFLGITGAVLAAGGVVVRIVLGVLLGGGGGSACAEECNVSPPVMLPLIEF